MAEDSFSLEDMVSRGLVRMTARSAKPGLNHENKHQPFSTVKNHAVMLLMDGCGFCTKYAPHIEKAAEELQEQGIEVTIVSDKMDGFPHTSLFGDTHVVSFSGGQESEKLVEMATQVATGQLPTPLEGGGKRTKAAKAKAAKARAAKAKAAKAKAAKAKAAKGRAKAKPKRKSALKLSPEAQIELNIKMAVASLPNRADWLPTVAVSAGAVIKKDPTVIPDSVRGGEPAAAFSPSTAVVYLLNRAQEKVLAIQGDLLNSERITVSELTPEQSKPFWMRNTPGMQPSGTLTKVLRNMNYRSTTD